MDVKCHIVTNQFWTCLQHGSYELPLLWRETPVKVSCPVSRIQSQSDGPLSVCCSRHSMSVKVQQASAAELLRVNGKNDYPVFQHTTIRVNVLSLNFNELMIFFRFATVRGQWTPLVELLEPCGFTVDGQDGKLTIVAPYITCGIAVVVNFRGSPAMAPGFHYLCS